MSGTDHQNPNRLGTSSCSDRLKLVASGQRGGGLASGHVAAVDRRRILQDIWTLRDILTEINPHEARRLTRGITSQP